nr:family 10 glycosylhydrolase [Faecalibacterium prausnitzii]
MPAGEWRAVWVSYLDWALLDFSTEDTFRAGAAQLLDNCAGLGLNTVLAQVRPFGDALYRSSLFPWSHLCTGVQGKDPGFDPLDVFLTEAHRRGIGVEAWVNPYRLRSSAAMPPNLAENNLANTHPDWLCTAGEGLYLNPAVPAAADYVVQGVAELLQNYPVDGIHFDDYFYPTTDAAVDAAQFAASGAADLAVWRRQNVTALVAKVHRTVKAADPTLRFGISPQGNPDNDLDQQYSDVTAWLAAGGEEKVIDYLCPQVYWGYGFTLQSGSTRFAFENIVPAWLSYPRAGDVALYFGLGAYRVGTGDGGANPGSVSGWSTGSALAAQVKDLRQQAAGGWALYRYGSLFGAEAPALAEAECAALRALNG